MLTATLQARFILHNTRVCNHTETTTSIFSDVDINIIRSGLTHNKVARNTITPRTSRAKQNSAINQVSHTHVCDVWPSAIQKRLYHVSRRWLH